MNQVVKQERASVVPQAVTPDQMLAIAVEQGADIDKLEKLMALQERWEAGQAKKSYTRALSAFRAECPAIDKTRNGHNTKYAGLAETIEQIKPLLAEHGLSHSWKTSQLDDGRVKVSCSVTHVDGHSESTELAAAPDGSGSKNGIQAIGSAVSYLERYTLYAILGLASKEMDNDGAGADAGLSDTLAALSEAKDMDALQSCFKAAWNSFPKSAARQKLTAAKDQRKKELSNG
tara:strand:+ start:1122 stop:1817 length:696 start_codon:yes stop_codon:yes gene_type:complete